MGLAEFMPVGIGTSEAHVPELPNSERSRGMEEDRGTAPVAIDVPQTCLEGESQQAEECDQHGRPHAGDQCMGA